MVRNLRRFIPAFLFLLWPAFAGAITPVELPGDGVDNASAYTAGSCPTGYIDAVVPYTAGGTLGCDKLRPTPDADGDGFASVPDGGTDCNDHDRKDIPLAYVTTGCSAGQYRKCQANGTYTACTATPPTEATGSGHDYYFDWTVGVNGRTCLDPANPCKDYLPFAYFYNPVDSEKPANWHFPIAGDHFWFKDGTYTTTYTPGDGGGTTVHQFWLRAVTGTSTDPIVIKAYPGHHPKFSNSSNSSAPLSPVYILDAPYVTLDGIEVGNVFGEAERAGIFINASGDTIQNSYVHDVDCTDNSNCSGIYVGADPDAILLDRNYVSNNFDRTNADTGGNATENSRQIGIFEGYGIVRNNTLWNVADPSTVTKTGAGVIIKHARPCTIMGSTKWEFLNNSVWNVKFEAIGSDSKNTWIHKNITGTGLDTAFLIKDYGGTSCFDGTVIEYNTTLSGSPFGYTPNRNWNDSTGAYDDVGKPGTIGTLVVQKNVFKDTKSSYNPAGNAEEGFYVAAVYGSDTDYNDANPDFSSVNNCFFNPNAAISFNYFGANGGAYGTLGAVYNFAAWVAFGKDAGSYNRDPQFDSYLRATDTFCADKGWLKLSDESNPAAAPATSNHIYSQRIAKVLKGRRVFK